MARLWKVRGFEVTVVTRNQSNADRFDKLGYQACVADITQPDSLACVPNHADVVLFSVGFDRARYNDIRDVYVDGLQNVLSHLQLFSGQFVYISSTGVYGQCDGQWVDESTSTEPLRPGGKACLDAEQLIRDSALADRCTILRLAGIYGPGRTPRLQAIQNRDWSQLSPYGHVNLIHRADAAHIIDILSQEQVVNETFLVSDGEPVLRRVFYEFIAKQLNVLPIDWSVVSQPDVSQRASADKKISNRKLLRHIDYKFVFPDYQSGIVDALASMS